MITCITGHSKCATRISIQKCNNMRVFLELCSLFWRLRNYNRAMKVIPWTDHPYTYLSGSYTCSIHSDNSLEVVDRTKTVQRETQAIIPTSHGTSFCVPSVIASIPISLSKGAAYFFVMLLVPPALRSLIRRVIGHFAGRFYAFFMQNLLYPSIQP
jgi:hypothetical protein